MPETRILLGLACVKTPVFSAEMQHGKMQQLREGLLHFSQVQTGSFVS
jgi:hypothetical protein